MRRIDRKLLMIGLSLIGIVIVLMVLSVMEKNIEERREQRSLSDLPSGWQIILRGENIMDLAECRDYIWAGGRDGVYKISKKQPQDVEKIQFASEVIYVTSLLFDADGKLWIGHERGVTIRHGESETRWSESDVLPDNRVNTLYMDKEGRVWIGSWGGATVYDGKNWKTYTQSDGLTVDMVNAILVDQTGSTWFGAYNVRGGAVSVKINDKWHYYSMENGLPNNNIVAFLETDQSNIWIATGFYNRGGAARMELSGHEWQIAEVLEKEDGLAGEKVRSIYLDQDDRFWLGSEFDGLTIKDGNGTRILTADDGLSHNEILSIIMDEFGKIWLGTMDGLTILDEKAIDTVFASGSGLNTSR